MSIVFEPLEMCIFEVQEMQRTVGVGRSDMFSLQAQGVSL